MNIGLLLTNVINDNNNKRLFLSTINKYKENKIKEQEEIFEKNIYYNNNYQKKRDNNDELYLNYFQKYTELKDNWMKSNKENDLEKLKNLKKPELLDVDDIYTYMLIRNKKFKN